jgi:NAD(P)-dependent dehydrogenase (short-subunit alcohol dehydrogenase family)
MANRSVVITGGFGALGRAVGQAFGARDDWVTRIDLAPQASDRIAGGLDLGGIDLTDESAVAAAVAQVVTSFGGVDVLVNVAGGFEWQLTNQGDAEPWTRMYATNVLSALTMTTACLPSLKAAQQGRIINIGAGAAIKAAAGMGPYAAAKAGVHRLTEALAAELAETRVTANAVLPSIIDTPANRADMSGANFDEWVKPGAIADIIVFLASPAAAAISGALIPVGKA